MDRRDFIRRVGLGLAAGWVCGKLSWPLPALGHGPNLRLALLADAHLKSADSRLPEARALARAVAEINALTPSPDLVLFAGDLAHQGRPDALDLGREILSDLSSPMWAVAGEGDIGRVGAVPWKRRFGQPRFSRSLGGVHFLGLDTTLGRTPQGLAFKLGSDQRSWLAQELARLDSATPLVIVSHAPLARLFLPWQQWTADAPKVVPLLARFRQILCLHGHVHTGGIRKTESRYQGLSGVRNDNNGDNDFGSWSLAENRKPETANRLVSVSLPATAWPCPEAVQGTPAVARPGLGPCGCGWFLGTVSPANVDFQPLLWQA